MKLSKQEIDKVRLIEGFPIARDEDIIALSRPPYYTACPNPFIEDFIRENGTPYDEATDDYHREPFAADISEGKSDPVYKAHGYHTKVPYRAIMRYILHYTKPGDIVFDGFCGTGMTGVAAQMCGYPDPAFKAQIESEFDDTVEWGVRKAILSDLSPAATYITYSYNSPVDVKRFEHDMKSIMAACNEECGWMYETQHVDGSGQPIVGLSGEPMIGRINYTVWSDVFVCPACSNKLIFWDVAVDYKGGKVKESFCCNHCGAELKKRDCERARHTYTDSATGEVLDIAEQAPVMINYSVGTKRYEKKPDSFDYAIIERIEREDIPHPFPHYRVPDGDNTEQPRRSHGVEYIHQFYYKRTLRALANLRSKIRSADELVLFTKVAMRLTKLYRLTYQSGTWGAGGGPMNGTLYISSLCKEINVCKQIEENLKDLIVIKSCSKGNDALISCQSASSLTGIGTNSIDYIFVDPPFGGNINYSELSFIWEAWLGVLTNNSSEGIINSTQKKCLAEYQAIMEQCFSEFCRILKPGHWITIEFHNSQNSVWNALQEAIMHAGLIVADVRVLDKQQNSFKQATSTSAVKQDLVISAYKPKDSFVRAFSENAGNPEMAWAFVRQHLENVPIVADGNRDGKLDIIAERQDYLLFDRMVAWHIMNGIPVPVDAHTFFEGLRQRFLQRDGMFFLPDQVNEYDEKRAHMELDVQQLAFLVTDEKNAIAWLNYILRDGPKTYQEIQPAYLQELHQSKQEKMPELLDMLRENFVQDEKGAWYVPDLSNAADLAKVRRKALLKEFYDSCVPGKAKLKVFRMEAIRAGFDECWKARDFKTIVAVGEKLPEAVLQEDPALLMYYDNACARV